MLNSVALIGYLPSVPVVKKLKSGKPIATFEVQCARDYKYDGKLVYDFIPCKVFAPGAVDFVDKYLSKSSCVSVTGRVQTEIYKDQHDKMHKVTYLLVYTVQALKTGKKSADTNASVDAAATYVDVGEEGPLSLLDW